MYAAVPGSGSGAPTRPPAASTGTAVRPFIAFAVLALALYSLLAHWQHSSPNTPMFPPELHDSQTVFEIDVAKARPKPAIDETVAEPGSDGHEGGAVVPVYNPAQHPRRVVAHFMLGNTYPFTEKDWETTLIMAEAVGLDGLALNLGPEHWQLRQAEVAFNIASQRIFHKKRKRPLRLFLSLDMNVLPAEKLEDAYRLADKIAPLFIAPAYMKRHGHPILSTFSGEHAFGPNGWRVFLDYLNARLARPSGIQPVFFWPTFFTDTQRFIGNKDADGLFAWNSAWPMSDNQISIEPDLPYLTSGKPFMAAVSPLFFTHYGKEGLWAFNKNWVYRSDDLLYPNRWSQILALSPSEAPEMIQVLSWNDYGESHNIAPVLGHEPGSHAWTKGMDHIAFREMTSYFIQRWRDHAPEVHDKITVWMWYRTHPKRFYFPDDPVGRPHNTDWAQDLINIMVLVPKGLSNPIIEVHNGMQGPRSFKLFAGHANGLKVGFLPGQVTFKIRSDMGVHVIGRGKSIAKHADLDAYNFNMWSHAWHVKPEDIMQPMHAPAAEAHPSPTLAYHPVEEVPSGTPATPANDDDAHEAYAHGDPEPSADTSTNSGSAAHPADADVHPGNGEYDPSPLLDEESSVGSSVGHGAGVGPAFGATDAGHDHAA